MRPLRDHEAAFVTMRLAGWEERLLSAAEAWEREPFRWEDGGCLAPAFDAVEAITGTSPIERPSFAGEKCVARFLVKLKANTLEDALSRYFETVPVALAWRGAIGVAEHDGVQSAVVNMGPFWTGKTRDGAIHLPRDRVKTAFKV